MTRPWRISLGVSVGVVAVAMLAVIAGIYVAQSDWFREKLRQRVVAEAEKATGGRVEIGSFSFNWKTRTARVYGLVIHGNEPAGAEPLFQVKTLLIGLKLVSLVKEDIDILFVRLDTPEAFLRIAADGSTNVPNPKMRTNSKSPLQEMLDLKVREFALAQGRVTVDAAGQVRRSEPFDLKAADVQSNLGYRADSATYSGNLSAKTLDLKLGDYQHVPVNAQMEISIGNNEIRISEAKLTTSSSHLDLSARMENLADPLISAEYKGAISLKEFGSIANLRTRQSGTVELSGDARYRSASDYRASGTLHSAKIDFSDKGVHLADVVASSHFEVKPKLIELTNLNARAPVGAIQGKVEIRDLERYEISGHLSQFEIARLTARQLPYDGLLSGPVRIEGRFNDRGYRYLNASVELAIAPAGGGVPLNGLVAGKYDAANDQIVLGPSYLALPHSRLDLRGVLGQRMQVLLDTSDLSDLQPTLASMGEKGLPFALKSGSVHFDGSIIGKLEAPSLEGHTEIRNIVYSGQLLESINSDLSAASNQLSLRNTSIAYQNLHSAIQGSVGLQDWKVTGDSRLNLTANLRNASAGVLLALAGRKDIPVTGAMNVAGRLTGSVAAPEATADFTLSGGAAYGEPFDQIAGRLDGGKRNLQSIAAQWKAGSREMTLNAQYQHAPNSFQRGSLTFQIASNRLVLSQFAYVRREEPGLSGTATVNAKGTVLIDGGSAQLTDLSGGAAATGVKLDGRELSDLKLTALTNAGALQLHLESNLAQAEIAGEGVWKLTSGYPGSGRVNFAKLDLAVARKLLLPLKDRDVFKFGGNAEGHATISGSLTTPAEWTSELEIPRFELKPDLTGSLAKDLADVTIRNTQTMRFSLSREVIRVESARLTGPNTDVSLLGTVNLNQKEPLNLTLNGNVDLKLARTFNQEIDSSGNLLVRVTLRGSFEHPQLGGLADLRNGNLSIAGFPNGLSNASGRVTFDENRANIQSLSAQTGGGTVQLTGFAAVTGSTASFRLNALAKGVRVRYPEGVSSVSDANLTWTGSTERSVLAGAVTVHKVTYNQQSDLGSVLSIATGTGPTQVAPTGIIGGTQFDVKVQTAPDISFQTGLVSGLQTDANLRLRGTAANPSLLGRINISSGNIEFLGNKYLINEGTISFFNPVRIEPIVNVDLSTQARGVDVTLSVAGPLNKLNVTYRSDPPLQFSDIVALLATGKTPSDPTIAARQSDTEQTWQQLGASALVGQAIANPVSGRLQRFFGVSRLKIDPLLPGLGGAGSSTGGSNPGARLSLEQQVAPNVTFDYVISTNSTSSQIVRVEWAFSKHWSAVILREENSAFGIDFQYKKRFK